MLSAKRTVQLPQSPQKQHPAKFAHLLQVNELTMQNEYQLRLRELATNQKAKELPESRSCQSACFVAGQ